MSDVLLVLGPIVFRDFEVPSGINLGGRQRLVTHRLPGGARVVDALGRDDAEISFAGIFSGSDATLRARMLDELRADGSALPLTWDVFYYTVLIADFRADYRNGWWIPYRITCTVLQDEALAAIAPTISLTTAALADGSTAINLASSVGIDLSALSAAIAAPGATVRGTEAYSAAQTSIVGAQTTLASSIDSANATVVECNGDSSSRAQGEVVNLLSVTDAFGQLSALTSANSYVGRTAVNLANAST